MAPIFGKDGKKMLDAAGLRQDLLGIGRTSGTPDLAKARPASPSAEASGVGYGRPPGAHRFVKGKSGNPKGRPAKAAEAAKAALRSPADTVLREHFATPMQVMENGQPATIGRLNGYLKMLEKQGAGGSVLAMRTLTAMAIEASRAEETERLDEVAYWRAYIDGFPQLQAQALSDGHDLPDHMPRPEDIFLEPGKWPQIIGPWTEEGLVHVLTLRRWRDALYLKYMYDLVMQPPDGRRFVVTTDFLCVLAFDRLMPTRWKLDNSGLPEQVDVLMFCGCRKFAAELCASLANSVWRCVSRDAPRSPQTACCARSGWIRNGSRTSPTASGKSPNATEQLFESLRPGSI